MVRGLIEMGYDFSIEPRDERISVYDPNGPNSYYFYFNDPAALANSYRSRLSVAPIEEDASLVTLTTSGFVPSRRLITLINLWIFI